MTTTDATNAPSAPSHRLDALEAALVVAGGSRAQGGRRRQRHRGDAGLLPRRRPLAVREARRVRRAGVGGALAAGRGRSHRCGGVTVKPFEATLRAGLGTTAWRRGFVTLNPHVSWKGRTINALGEPIDGGGPLQQGDAARVDRARAAGADAAAARPHAREDGRQGHRPLHAAVRRPAHRHLRRLRHRQVDAARHARPLAGLRHRRHRARRRARPRGARVHGGCAGAGPGARGGRRRHRR